MILTFILMFLCVFACSPCDSIRFLQVLWFLHTVHNHAFLGRLKTLIATWYKCVCPQLRLFVLDTVLM